MVDLPLQGSQDMAPAPALDAYIQRDQSGTIQRGCVMRSGSSMRALVLRFVGRDAPQPLENSTVGAVLSGAGMGMLETKPGRPPL